MATKPPLYRRGTYHRKNTKPGRWLIYNDRYLIGNGMAPNRRKLRSNHNHREKTTNWPWVSLWIAVAPNGKDTYRAPTYAELLVRVQSNVYMKELKDKYGV